MSAPVRWWRFAVLRGEGIPAELNGVWFDVNEMRNGLGLPPTPRSVTLDATNEWEQRDDGEVAVVYRWVRRP